jgi:hypothetical protein
MIDGLTMSSLELTLLGVEAAARAAGLPVGALDRWVVEHRMSVRAQDDDQGCVLYLEADVLEAERLTRRAPRVRRLPAVPRPRPKSRLYRATRER